MIEKNDGTMIEVFGAQFPDFVDRLSRNDGREANKVVIYKDIPRSAVVIFDGTFNDFETAGKQEANFDYPYMQGKWDGGSIEDFPYIIVGQEVMKLYDEAAQLPLGEQRSAMEAKAQLMMQELAQNKRTLRFAYRNDEHVWCSVGIFYLDSKPGSYLIQVVEDTMGAQPLAALYSKNFTSLKNSKEIALDDFSEDLAVVLKSKKIGLLLSSIFNENKEIAEKEFQELSSRLNGGRNIDDRDIKMQALREIMEELDASQREEINQKVENDIDFFKTANFEEFMAGALLTQKQNQKLRQLVLTEDLLSSYILGITTNSEEALAKSKGGVRAKLSQLEEDLDKLDEEQKPKQAADAGKENGQASQGFWKQNRGAIAVAGILLVLSVALLATGFLAPIGAVIAGIVTKVAVASTLAFFATVLSIAASVFSSKSQPVSNKDKVVPEKQPEIIPQDDLMYQTKREQILTEQNVLKQEIETLPQMFAEQLEREIQNATKVKELIKNVISTHSLSDEELTTLCESSFPKPHTDFVIPENKTVVEELSHSDDDSNLSNPEDDESIGSILDVVEAELSKAKEAGNLNPDFYPALNEFSLLSGVKKASAARAEPENADSNDIKPQ